MLVDTLAHLGEHLRCQNDPVAPSILCQPTPDNFFSETQVKVRCVTAGRENAVSIGGVKKLIPFSGA